LAEVDLAYLLSDFKSMLTAASHAADRSKGEGARLLLARAQRAQGQAYYYLGESGKALASFAEAREIYAAAGDRRLTAGVLRDFADCLALQGDYGSALEDTVNHSLSPGRLAARPKLRTASITSPSCCRVGTTLQRYKRATNRL
jgi:tetratricopeptide (TPR) repeat protein